MAKRDTHEPSGIQKPMPKAPGNAKAGQPPRREEAGGELPAWLDPKNVAWPKERVGRFQPSSPTTPKLTLSDVAPPSQLPVFPVRRISTSFDSLSEQERHRTEPGHLEPGRDRPGHAPL